MIALAPNTSVSSKPFSGLLAAICALAILLAPSAAEAATGSDMTPELSLTFPTKQAQLSGSRASVWSTCRAPEAQVCHGTVTLTTSGNEHRAPFSVIAGTIQRLTVPLGADSTAERVVALVSTAQGNGVYTHSRTVLRLR